MCNGWSSHPILDLLKFLFDYKIPSSSEVTISLYFFCDFAGLFPGEQIEEVVYNSSFQNNVTAYSEKCPLVTLRK